MSPFDLSYRHKIPLWGSVLVIMTALAVSTVLMIQTYKEMEEDLVIDTATLADALAPHLFAAMLDGNAWRAYEIVSTPLETKRTGPNLPGKAENIIVVDGNINVFAAAYPKRARLGVPLDTLGPEFATMAERLRVDSANMSPVTNAPGSPRLLYTIPIADEGIRLGTLIIVLTKGSFLPRFFEISRYGLAAGLVLLCILLPFNWYWGRRMAAPLVQLTQRMQMIGKRMPERLDPRLYTHDDEIGSLFQSYNKMLAEMKEKAELEKQVVQSDRLAALGQLAASVAHEINNPLGGMLMAIDTLKSQTVPDARTAKTIALLERGLGQIKDTVGALLVEARLKSRNLSATDMEDVLLLVLPQAHKKQVHLDWRNELVGEVRLPASLVRQVMINLLLNAVHAANKEGLVSCHIRFDELTLHVSIANDGKVLTPEQMSHLFEPFSPLSEDGHGLGLWVSYQIVNQLGGKIGAASKDGRMQFLAIFPIGGHSS